jgi:protein O-mannosyl-transferase
MTRYLTNFVIALLAFGLYVQTIGFDFAYDDYLQIIHSPLVAGSENGASTWRRILFTPTPPGNLYRPLPVLSYAITFKIFGLNAAVYHATNIFLFSVLVVATHALFNRFLPAGLALIACLVFLFHPIHVEAVANIIGRAELFSGIFSILTLLLLSESRWVERTPVGEHATAFVSAFCFMLLAMFSKESAVCTLPLLVLLPIFGASAISPFERMYRVRGPLLGATAGVIVAIITRWRVVGHSFLFSVDPQIYPENPLLALPLVERVVPSLWLLSQYVRHLIVPVGLSADYSIMPNDLMDRIYSLFGIGQMALLLFSGLAIWTTARGMIRYWLLWIPTSLFVALNLLTPIGTIMGDRLALLAAIGFSALLVSLLWRTFGALRPTYLATGVAIAFFGATNLMRQPAWKDNRTLFEQTVKDSPLSPKAHYNLGIHRFLHSPSPSLAEPSFREALRLHPSYVLAARAMADLSFRRGEAGRLEYWYRYILKLTPNDTLVQKNLKKLQELKASRATPRENQ